MVDVIVVNEIMCEVHKDRGILRLFGGSKEAVYKAICILLNRRIISPYFRFIWEDREIFPEVYLTLEGWTVADNSDYLNL